MSIISNVLSAVIGVVFALIGYGVNTWQFWVFAVPVSGAIGWFDLGGLLTGRKKQ